MTGRCSTAGGGCAGVGKGEGGADIVGSSDNFDGGDDEVYDNEGDGGDGGDGSDGSDGGDGGDGSEFGGAGGLSC